MTPKHPTAEINPYVGLEPARFKDPKIAEQHGRPSFNDLQLIYATFNDSYDVTQLHAIIHELTDRWAHSNDHFALAKAAAVAFEMLHYRYVRGREPPESAVSYATEMYARAELRNVPRPNVGAFLADADLDPFGDES